MLSQLSLTSMRHSLLKQAYCQPLLKGAQGHLPHAGLTQSETAGMSTVLAFTDISHLSVLDKVCGPTLQLHHNAFWYWLQSQLPERPEREHMC